MSRDNRFTWLVLGSFLAGGVIGGTAGSVGGRTAVTDDYATAVRQALTTSSAHCQVAISRLRNDLNAAITPCPELECPTVSCPDCPRPLCLCSHENEYGELYAMPPDTVCWGPDNEWCLVVDDGELGESP